MANDKSLKVKNGLSAKRYMQGAGTATGSSTTSGPVDAFSTDLYDGDATTNHKITTNIDLSTDGGLVWIKRRSDSSNHRLMDTERGASSYLESDTQNSAGTGALTSFDTDGFTIGNASAPINAGSGSTYVAWSFKQQSSFFDVVQYTGDGTSSRSVSHNLGSGSTVGAIIVKAYTGGSEDWIVWHRGISNEVGGEIVNLNQNNSKSSMNGKFDDTNLPTSTDFTVEQDNSVNASNVSYIAYVFAHDTSADGYIQCGSYTGDGTTNHAINLGWKPQFIILKRSDAIQNWWMFDLERGWEEGDSGGVQKLLNPDRNVQEVATSGYIHPTDTGFTLDSSSNNVNGTGAEYIYIAIREGATNYSQTIDLSTGHYFSVTMSNPTTFSFTNPPASGVATSFVIELNNNESAITWPSSVKWSGGTAPAATSTKDIYKFITTDGGTTYYGALSGGAMA